MLTFIGYAIAVWILMSIAIFIVSEFEPGILIFALIWPIVMPFVVLQLFSAWRRGDLDPEKKEKEYRNKLLYGRLGQKEW